MSQEPPNAQRPTPPLAPKCESCGAKAARTYYCRSHDVVLCGGCAWSRHASCTVWRLIEEVPEVDADEERLKSHHRASERMRAFAVEREAGEGAARFARRVNAVVLAVVAGLVALMLALAMGCCSAVPGVVAEKAPAARRAAEVYVEATDFALDDPRFDAEERDELRALGRSLVRYLEEMEAATR